MTTTELSILLLTTALAILSSVVTTVITYRVVGRRQKVDETKIKRGYDFGEEVVKLFGDVSVAYENLYDWYQRDYKFVDNADAVNNFLQNKLLFEKQYGTIDRLISNRNTLLEKIRIGRLYLNAGILNKMKKYVDLGNFNYSHDGGIFFNTFYESFFENLIDSSIDQQRRDLKKSITNELTKLVP